MNTRMTASLCCILGCVAANVWGGLTVRTVPVGSSTIAGGQQVTLEVLVESDVDQWIRGGQVDVPCLLDNGQGTLTSVQILGDAPAGGVPPLCSGGIIAANSFLCQLLLTAPLGGPNCFLPAGQLRYTASITYEVSDCAEGSFSVDVEGVSLPPTHLDTTSFKDADSLDIPITGQVAAQLTLGDVSVGACCDGQTCLEDGIYAGCCTQTYSWAQFYLDRSCADADPCRGPCCLPDGNCGVLDAPSCTAQGGIPQPNSSACAAPEACCLTIGSCQMMDRSCCVAQGGSALGAGSNCDDPYACCTPTFSYPLLWTEPWAAPGKIKGAQLNGSNRTTLVAAPAPANLSGIAVDREAGKMYWCESDLSQAIAKISRANLDGTGVETVIASDVLKPIAVALDVAAGKMYWTDNGNNVIQRASLDGSGIELLVTDDDVPNTLTLDPAAGTVYWTTMNAKAIRRANLDGSGVVTLVSNRPGRTQFIALDVAGGKMYWTESGSGSAGPSVNRANLDGSAVETLVVPQSSAFGIALDLAAGKMYWAAGKIQRANLDGTGVEDLVTDLSAPHGLALALSPVYGDMDSNNLIDVDDIFCVLLGFVNQVNCPRGDLHPCPGNDLIDVDDITTMLTLFVQSSP